VSAKKQEFMEVYLKKWYMKLKNKKSISKFEDNWSDIEFHTGCTIFSTFGKI